MRAFTVIWSVASSKTADLASPHFDPGSAGVAGGKSRIDDTGPAMSTPATSAPARANATAAPRPMPRSLHSPPGAGTTVQIALSLKAPRVGVSPLVLVGDHGLTGPVRSQSRVGEDVQQRVALISLGAGAGKPDR
jgi:hypothetical protein